MLAAAVCRVKPLFSANDRSRWCTVWSLVERGTFQIDEIDATPGWGTIDKVRHQGHFYSSKPPVLPIIVAGVYRLERAVTRWNLDDQTDEAARTILLLVNVLPMLVGVVVMAALVERYARSDFARIFTVAAFALTTFLTTFAVTLNNHTVAALAILFATYPACRILDRRLDVARRIFFWPVFLRSSRPRTNCRRLPLPRLSASGCFARVLRRR